MATKTQTVKKASKPTYAQKLVKSVQSAPLKKAMAKAKVVTKTQVKTPMSGKAAVATKPVVKKPVAKSNANSGNDAATKQRAKQSDAQLAFINYLANTPKDSISRNDIDTKRKSLGLEPMYNKNDVSTLTTKKVGTVSNSGSDLAIVPRSSSPAPSVSKKDTRIANRKAKRAEGSNTLAKAKGGGSIKIKSTPKAGRLKFSTGGTTKRK